MNVEHAARGTEHDVHVFFTMDCERARPRDLSEFCIWGPPDWEFSERSIRRFDAILAEEGYVATYFIVPDTAVAHAGMWAELAARGNELGLHLHAQGFGDMRWDRFFGEYDEDSQLKLLDEAMEAWATAVGRRPTVFRPGNFSGNPSVFGTLLKAGLVAGSVALPGRVRREVFADWRGFGASCRLLPSDADPQEAFLDVPVSASHARALGEGEHRDPLHLRVEAKSMGQDSLREVVAENLTGPVADPSLPRTLVVMTHNTPDYAQAEYEDRLRSLIGITRACVAEAGLRAVNGTIDALRRGLVASAGAR